MSKPTYSDSNGKRWTTEQIDRKSKKSALLLLELRYLDNGYNFCEICNRSTGTYFDVSHTESRKVSKENGRCEKCWDLDNMRVLCRSCHRKFDKN